MLLRRPLRARPRRVPRRACRRWPRSRRVAPRGASSRSRSRSGSSRPRSRRSPMSAGLDAALSLNDICASYSGHQVVHHVTFDVERGECVALVGESGSGKSTLSKSIGGLHHEWTGALRVAGMVMANAAARPVDEGTAGDPVRVPESVPVVEPAAHDRRLGVAATGDRRRGPGPTPPGRRRDARTGLAVRAPTRTSTLTSSPAASASAPRSPGRS